MKGKRLLSFLLALALCLSLAACGTQTPPKESGEKESTAAGEKTADEGEKKLHFTPGLYTEKTNGHNGAIEVKVEFTDAEIKDIAIGKNEETETVAKAAFERIPEAILKHQSVAVDSVSGATVTSAAIKEAVLAAADHAGADLTLLKKELPKATAKDPVKLEADIAIVGGGGAGMTAALAADDAGKSVILLEKNAMLGGHTAFSGAYVLITGSKLQSEKYGIKNDTLQSVYDDIMKNGGGKSIPEDLKLYVDQMGPATDWINDHIQAPIPDKLTPLSENSVDRAMVYEGAGFGLNEVYKKKMAESKVDVHLDTKAKDLIVENGRVVGVQAIDKEGTTVEVRAKAVLLATGSYGARKDLLPKELDNFVFYGAQLAQGEGMEMAQRIGADVVNQGYVELFENGVEWKPGIAKSTYNGSMAAWDVSGILVDREGKRVVNERAAGIDIVKQMAKQPDGRLFLLMDQKTFDHFRDNVGGYGISQEMLDGWLENNGKDAPYFAHAEMLEDAAKIVQVDPKNLKETVDRYNSFVDKGKDEDFGRDAAYMTAKIGEGPYYLVEQKPRFATTLGGLKINPKLQVINQEGKVIEGLYAAGDVAGGARGNDSIPGSDVGWALTSGYFAGKTISDLLSE